MDWQLLIVIVCVCGAALYLIRKYASFLLPQTWRAKNHGCGSGCSSSGCSSRAPSVATQKTSCSSSDNVDNP